MDFMKEFILHLTGEPCKEIRALNGGVTNGSYLVRTEAHQYVIRMPGEGTNRYINREYEINNIKQALSLNCVPDVIFADRQTGILVTRYIENNIPMSQADIHDPKRLRLVCECLGSIHRSGIQFGNEFNISEQMRSYQQTITEMGILYPQELQEHMQTLEGVVNELFAHPEKLHLIACHGDPKLNNFLLQGDKMWLIDWEYSDMAEFYFDIVNMVMTNDLNQEEEGLLLSAYEMYMHQTINRRKYMMYRIAADYLWIFWHLIKLNQGSFVEYNTRAWKKRLNRALDSYNKLEALDSDEAGYHISCRVRTQTA